MQDAEATVPGCHRQARSTRAAGGSATGACRTRKRFLTTNNGKLYSNRGAMTPGVTWETVDGMSLAKIGAIIGALRAERYRWQPVKPGPIHMSSTWPSCGTTRSC